VPFITPQDIPESDDCRSLSIPASSEWLALFGGALTEFLYSYNWEQTTGITVDDTIAKMREIVNGFYDGCAPCTYEGGLRIIRIGIGGHLEELGDDGTWGEPTGEYVIPAPDAREGGTEADQICLASKNAANVLKILYESWTESWASELTLDEAIVAAIAALVAIPAFFLFAPIAGAIALAIAGFLEIMFEAIEFLTADLWDEAFTNEIVCLFQSCATNTDGVVTFDWSCLNDAINARIDSFSLTDEQLRLYGQIGYLMYFIGGTDGVNLAGSTTAITDDNCDFCDDVWCYEWDLTLEDGGMSIAAFPSSYGVWTSGVGWESQNAGGGNELLQIARVLSEDTDFTSMEIDLNCITNNDNNNGAVYLDHSTVGVAKITWSSLHLGTFTLGSGEFSPYASDEYGMSIGNGGNGHFAVTRLKLTGNGTNPFGENNC